MNKAELTNAKLLAYIETEALLVPTIAVRFIVSAKTYWRKCKLNKTNPNFIAL